MDETLKKLEKLAQKKGFAYIANKLNYKSDSAIRQWIYRNSISHREIKNVERLIKEEFKNETTTIPN